MSSQSAVVSFPEHTCWNDEDFRHIRKQVVLRVYSCNSVSGGQFDLELHWDYGVWYHRNDDILIQRLSASCPTVDWGKLIYHRSWDRWDIDICDPEDDSLVARVEVRQYRGTSVDGLDVEWGGNVVRLDDYRTSKLNELCEKETERLFADGS